MTDSTDTTADTPPETDSSEELLRRELRAVRAQLEGEQRQRLKAEQARDEFALETEVRRVAAASRELQALPAVVRNSITSSALQGSSVEWHARGPEFFASGGGSIQDAIAASLADPELKALLDSSEPGRRTPTAQPPAAGVDPHGDVIRLEAQLAEAHRRANRGPTVHGSDRTVFDLMHRAIEDPGGAMAELDSLYRRRR